MKEKFKCEVSEGMSL